MPVKTLIYLVWSNKHSSWHGPDARGYTNVTEAAGRFTEGEALDLVVKGAHSGKRETANVMVAAPECWD